MRDDLLDAQAVVDWAQSDLPHLQAKIDHWRADAPYGLTGDVESMYGKKLIRLCNIKPIPLAISAEAGVIIHSIRSSLDILAVALAERNGATDPTDVYFPICKSLKDFQAPRGGKGKIKALSASDQATIEALRPYQGGNEHLYSLHQLDLKRKHRRLVSVYGTPAAIIVSPEAMKSGVQFVAAWCGFTEGAVIATGPTHADERQILLDLGIRLAEPGPASTKPLIEALRDFASLATMIIKLFDTPAGLQLPERCA